MADTPLNQQVHTKIAEEVVSCESPAEHGRFTDPSFPLWLGCVQESEKQTEEEEYEYEDMVCEDERDDEQEKERCENCAQFYYNTFCTACEKRLKKPELHPCQDYVSNGCPTCERESVFD